MTQPPPGEHPLRVAIIGAGPAAFYAADHLLRQAGRPVAVDMFDRLPTPYGLVRNGVAPDHQKIKTVTRAFAQTAALPGFRFFGNVEMGRDITLEDIRSRYHAAIFATGAQTDRHMGIPGEDLARSHPATEFVAWYNGHPDYRDCRFDLSQEQVAIVGVGNVAVDVARILCLSREELERTDMPRYAIEALAGSRVRDVYLLGRRGPAQAAFTNPELKELGELEDADLLLRQDEVQLDALSREEVAESDDRALDRKVAMIQDFACREPTGRRRRLHLRFFVSPIEVTRDEHGGVAGVRLAHTSLARTDAGTLAARPTGEEELIPAGLLFRSVGYRGVPVPGVPFNERWAVILNDKGRVLDPETETPIPGEYAAGWIKRGPSGVIGTNKPDSVETATALLADAAVGRIFAPACPLQEAMPALLRARGVRYVTFDEWSRLDAMESAAGQQEGRPRVKFTSTAEMLEALRRG